MDPASQLVRAGQIGNLAMLHLVLSAREQRPVCDSGGGQGGQIVVRGGECARNTSCKSNRAQNRASIWTAGSPRAIREHRASGRRHGHPKPLSSAHLLSLERTDLLAPALRGADCILTPTPYVPKHSLKHPLPPHFLLLHHAPRAVLARRAPPVSTNPRPPSTSEVATSAMG